MQTKRNTLTGIALAAGVLLAAGAGSPIAIAADDAAAATPPPQPHGWGHGHGAGPAYLFGKLNLSDEQKASVKSIITAARPQMHSLHQSMEANHLKLMQTKPDDPNYANVVAQVAQSNATLASQRTSQAAELRTQMYAVLTPEQRTQLATLEAQAAAHAHHGRGGAPAEAGSSTP